MTISSSLKNKTRGCVALGCVPRLLHSHLTPCLQVRGTQGQEVFGGVTQRVPVSVRVQELMLRNCSWATGGKADLYNESYILPGYILAPVGLTAQHFLPFLEGWSPGVTQLLRTKVCPCTIGFDPRVPICAAPRGPLFLPISLRGPAGRPGSSSCSCYCLDSLPSTAGSNH